MKKSIYLLLLLAVASVVLIQSKSGMPKKEAPLPFYNTPDFTPRWIATTDKEYSSIHTIALFHFFNQNGKEITNKNVEGKIYVANFFFTKCGSICPKMKGNLEKVQAAFASDKNVMILSHTVMPEADSVQKLAEYARRNNINNEQWWLLTGSKDEIYKLARQSYFADEELGYNKGSNEFLHTENCILVDKHGRIRGVYNGTLELEMNKLIEHIRLLEKEE